MKQERQNKLIQEAKKLYSDDDPSHDWNHVLRVYKQCELIGEKEGANLEDLLPAALFHDIVNIPKNQAESSKASEYSAEKAKSLLKKCCYNDDEIERITQIIKEHSYSKGLAPSSLESSILQDADRLDAIGAIGIMRTVTCGSLFKAQYYNVQQPIPFNRQMDDKKYTLDHFYKKLLKLGSLMNTETARQIAKERTIFMEKFIKQLLVEITLEANYEEKYT